MVSIAYSHRIVCDTAFLKWLLRQPEKNELFRKLMFVKGSSQDWKKCHNLILETELNQDRTQIGIDDNSIGAAFKIMPNPKFLDAYKDQISKNINFAVELANDTPFKSYIFTITEKERFINNNNHNNNMKITCNNCNYSWDYNGKMTKIVNCPNCRKAVKLEGASSASETSGQPSQS